MLFEVFSTTGKYSLLLLPPGGLPPPKQYVLVKNHPL